jgi:subfamily B ATP-binding cassette protein MsbA
MMFYLEWRLALATCVIVPAVGLVLGPLGKRIRRTAAVAQGRLGGLAAMLQEQLHGATTIKGFQTEAFERDRFARENSDYRRQAMKSEWWSSMLLTAVWLVTGVGLLGILWYGSRQVLDGRITAGGLLAFCLYAVQTIQPLRHLSEVQSIVQRALAAAARVYEIIDWPEVETEVETAGGVSLPTCGGGDLQFERVRFRYSETEPVLEGIDLTVRAGEAVAVVGASGAGKSTLAKLLVRFDDPQRGRILLGGVDLRVLRLADLRRAVCVVEQDPFIFSGPLIDNIRYGSWQASYAAIESAVDLAGLGPFVRSLPGGLQALLDEGGGNLSGGQKQRIALARAIVRDPAVLVLDEASSAIDSDTERQIFARLEDWLVRRTVLVMAHRLSTVSRFGRVIVLEGGRIVGDASVRELRRQCPSFGELFAEQLSLAGEPRRAAGAAG